MFKRAITAGSALALLLALSVAPAEAYRGSQWKDNSSEWDSKFRLTASLGYNSSGLVNLFSFEDGPYQDGWNWELALTYRSQDPLFFEGGVKGWTLSGGDDLDPGHVDAKKIGLTATVGARFRGLEFGAGVVPSGWRLLGRHFLDRTQDNKGPVVQIGVMFPTTDNADTFADVSLGYAF